MSEENTKGDYHIEKIICPSCQKEGANVITHILDIPYYEDFAMLNINCSSCGYRTSDFLNLKEKDHTLMSYRVENETDNRTKIVRSKEGIVSIPELGIRIEPTGDGTSWIRNIEGVLEDIKSKIIISLRYSETAEEKRTVKQRIKLLKKLMKNEISFTIQVEDPSGNSVILPENPEKLEIEIIETVEEKQKQAKQV